MRHFKRRETEGGRDFSHAANRTEDHAVCEPTPCERDPLMLTVGSQGSNSHNPFPFPVPQVAPRTPAERVP